MINLLPPKEKQIVLEEKKLREIILLGVSFLIFLIFLGLILFSIRFDLDSRILVQEAFVNQKKREIENSEIKQLEQGIARFNQILSRVSLFYQNEYCLTEILEDLAGTLPSEVYLTNLTYLKEKKEISLSGFSPDRGDLSELKANLEFQEGFEDLYFPASNWVKPTNIDFFVRFKISD